MSSALRVGWLAQGRYRERVEHMKYVGTASTKTLTQLAIAEFIKQGYYVRHVRTIRQHYRDNFHTTTKAVKQHFPKGTRVSAPEGSYFLWVEIPGDIDTLELNVRLVKYEIQIAPGVIFSVSGKYRNCMRINYARPISDEVMRVIGEEVRVLMGELLVPYRP